MTHGEAWYKNKCDLHQSKSLELEDKIRLPKRMSREEATTYYRAKLFKHWLNDYDYDERVNETHKKEVISTFMLGNPKHYEKYKELQVV